MTADRLNGLSLMNINQDIEIPAETRSLPDRPVSFETNQQLDPAAREATTEEAMVVTITEAMEALPDVEIRCDR